MTLEIIITIGVILAMVGIVYLIERRTKTRGAMFTGKSTPLMRILALVLGLGCSGYFVFELFHGEVIHCLFPILGFALLLYALGSERLLRKVQGAKESESGIREDS